MRCFLRREAVKVNEWRQTKVKACALCRQFYARARQSSWSRRLPGRSGCAI